MKLTGRTTGRTRWVAALTIGALVATANIAFADNVSNDLTSSANVLSVTQGSSGTVSYTVTNVNQNGGDPNNSCNLAGDGSLVISIGSLPAGVTAGSVTITACGDPESITFAVSSTATVGDHQITHTLAPNTAATGNFTNLADFTLRVVAASVADTAPPSWECAPAVSDGIWHATNQTSNCTASDAATGPASPAAFALSTSVADGTEDGDASTGTQEVCDAVTPTANCTTAGPITGWKIDRKAPTGITFVGAPTTVTLGAAFPSVTCTANDGGSGVDTCDVTGQDSSSIGTKTLTATATDNVGNQSSATTTYNVVFAWTGFLRPVDNLPTLNTVKAGSAVPVKFQLGGDQGLSVMAAGYPSSSVAQCDASAGTDAIEETATAGQSVLQYDSVTQTYTYVWKTDKAWAGSCRQLRVKLADGTVHAANFKLTK